jgi:transposase
MHLRKFRRTKDGKLHIYWGLVENVREGRKVRQRVVCYLGDLDKQQAASYEDLARSARTRPRHPIAPDLFSVAPPAAAPVEILPDQTRVENVRDFGDAWVGWNLWRMLELDRFFQEQCEPGREDIPWATMIAYAAIARFCEASSDLAVAESFTDRSALADLLGIDPAKVNDDRLYRALDRALPHKGALTRNLKERYGELFGVDYDLLLYDLTSTYFEGETRRNALARHGYSRDGRSDARQIVLALVVTREGLPLSHEVFPGNRTDVTTLRAIVRLMECKFGRAHRIWVMDRGIASEDNLAWLRQRGGHYLVGTPKGKLKNFEKELLSGNWREVRDGLDVMLARSPDEADEVFVLCRSRDRREKELAMLKRFGDRIEEGLAAIAEACQRLRSPLSDKIALGKRLGALLSKNSRAARLFDYTVEDKEGRLHLSWRRREPTGENWAERTAGHYMLRTNLSGELAPDQLWRAYIQLTEIEAAFRSLKTDLGLRPIFHQTPGRVKAHVLICFLALVMRKTFEIRLEQHGLGRSVGKVLAELRAWRSMDVVLQTTDGRELRLRRLATPQPALKIILQRMAMKPPPSLLSTPNVVEKQPPKKRQLQANQTSAF